MRIDGRKPDEMRPVLIERNYTKFAQGSVLIAVGNTKVICTASIEDSVPPHKKNTGEGWITSEYSLLPGSTPRRVPRESSRGKVGGRTHEIQRLIGRSMRAIADLSVIGERTIWLDCDVIQADGGTRVASITGAYVALVDAISWLKKSVGITGEPLLGSVAAVSVGVVDRVPLLDLCYEEDVSADVDMNIVLTGDGEYIELQGTAEKQTFSEEELAQMMGQAKKGISELTLIQKDALQR
ncbi:MAG: ribonuclease PH [Candidatus Scalindua rubra]|uniref:Ribonuclease PH n=1 Tax=Candidatus Scalindua brodae TaxID=237368 RepID=A0A0B0EKD3_9BACT|nr:MAG: ribonuclease PH [Candidatus Scalindua brodae]MBZ0109174.1 ribonuclease PH [Candidatus Scalindua rubra]TWU28979.1 Ribonuclease PH [Candidatus Brocadiaceae bacterium S225]